ncbi:MAG: hypothetical protein LC737_00210 [Chloroflexi bacterium]|nr:hypothetical protein [Chloroflexota bacterium]
MDAYCKQGYVFVPNLFDVETMARARAEADAMLERVDAAGKNVEATWKGSWREQLIGKPGNDDAPSTADVLKLAASVSSIHNVQYH